MEFFAIKPVVWNAHGYKRPGGATFTSGYPFENGFGHEEWNNSDAYLVTDNGQKKRLFHTEGFGNTPLRDCAGSIWIFMIASHDGKQELVGVAANATSLFDDRAERERYGALIQYPGERWEDAWKQSSVRARFKTLAKFKEKWKEQAHWMLTWVCPADSFRWFDPPIELDPLKLIQRKRFLTRYSTFHQIDRKVASKILSTIPEQSVDAVVRKFRRQLAQGGEASEADDIEAIQNDPKIKPTTKIALIQARLGQGRFRDDLIKIWGGQCSVGACNVAKVLRASHVVPWRAASNQERLDPENGLLLSANLDALFDSGLISFSDEGEMLISSVLSADQRAMFGIPGKLRRVPSESLKSYLARHRQIYFPV